MSKFAKGNPVRVTDPASYVNDSTGIVTRVLRELNQWIYDVQIGGGLFTFPERHLTLADPDVHEVLAEMAEQSGLTAESAPCITAEQWAKAVIAPDPVSAPSHYRSHPSGIETITITRHESFLRGNVLKYVLRAPYKGSEVQDLRKAAQYLQWEIDRTEAAQ